LTVKKADIPPGTSIVLWSDGTYLDHSMEVLENALQGKTLTPELLAHLIEQGRESFASELKAQGKEDRIDDHTLIIVPA
jgi:hypothetical protein